MEVDKAIHRKLAVDLFNMCWAIMGQESRTQEDNDRLERAAMASLYHWSIVGDATNASIGEWMASRVHIVLGNREEALRHAERCMEVTNAADLKDFYLAFAYEARARAHAQLGNSEICRADQLAAVSEPIEEEEDKKIFESDFFGGNWFGLDPAR